MTIDPHNKEQWKLADYLIREVTGRASGELVSECHDNLPHDTYFIGSLKPKPIDEGASFSQRQYQNKLCPSAFGADFRINTSNLPVDINVEINWNCYYRAVPTFNQQQTWMNPAAATASDEDNSATVGSEEPDDEDNSEEEIERPRERYSRRSREELFPRFKKHECRASGRMEVYKNETGELELNAQNLLEALDAEITAAINEINKDEETLLLDSTSQMFTIPNAALSDAERFEAFLQQKTVAPELAWKWEVNAHFFDHRTERNEVTLAVQFVNATPEPENRKVVDGFLFNPRAVFDFPKNLVLPFILELAPESFRYNRTMIGRGFNCGLSQSEEIPDRFLTSHVPIHTQWRYQTRTEPTALFAKLAEDPIPVLKSIASAMQNYLTEWERFKEKHTQEFGADWNKHEPEYSADLKVFEDEIERFNLGLSLIKSDPDIQLAFQLANKTFERAGGASKDRWRLFQIVFIVTQIPGIASLKPGYEQYLEDREVVDIIYFPTGGGKTEAYLGTLVFHAFFDRLRGKKAGVMAWIRFPLRLLTLQQTQRMADIISIAELIRRGHGDERLSAKGVARFSVGYYVGSTGTPNKLDRPSDKGASPEWSIATDARARQQWKRIVHCPSCKTTSVFVDFDEDLIKVEHRCSNESCEFEGGLLPIYVVDNEIYRYLPTVIVGTIDKLASLGLQRKLSMVFGKIDGHCKHGFYNDECCQKECSSLNPDPNYSRNLGLTGPTVFLQDELHLLKEGLGTFDSHYETFAQFLLAEYGQTAPLKMIASSATIEQYQRQVEHLYGKKRSQARRFPGSGPTAGESFYAETLSYPQRIFTGIIPHNKTLFNAMLELVEYYHTIIHELTHLSVGAESPFRGETEVGSEDWFKLLDLYYTSLSYFLATRDLDSFKTDFKSHVLDYLFTSKGIDQVNIKELTSGTSADEVAAILELLERPHFNEEPKEAVLATSMISHGVDIDRFNAMFFYGMPRQTAEYIQSSSRVGRKHVGIVFNCFHPLRERDQSHYGYYEKYHEFLGQLVEPAAINRWASYGINKTLPGLFNGMLLQVFASRADNKRNRFYMLQHIQRLLANRELLMDDVIELLNKAMKSYESDDERDELFRQRITEMVNHYADMINAGGVGMKWVSEALRPYRPMLSLRDIDQSIQIQLDRTGEEWASKLK